MWQLRRTGMIAGRGALDAAAAGGSYTGPGDVVSSATSWWGLWGYNAAYATGSNPAIDVVDQAGANPLTVNILANGQLDVASINTWVTANSVSTIRVTKVYDQVSTRHLTQATLANMPSLNLTGINSKPAMQFTAANSERLATGIFSVTQPLWYVSVFNKTGAASQGLFQHQGNFLSFSTNQPVLNFGTNLIGTSITPGTSYAYQAIASGATNSELYVNGATDLTGNAGTNNPTGNTLTLGHEGFNYWNGFIGEFGFWPILPNGTQKTNMNTNVKTTRWGF